MDRETQKLADIGHKLHSLSEQREQHVCKSNDLVLNSRHDFSLQQQKLLSYIISKISIYDMEFKEYSFSISEFCAVAGITRSGNNYEEIKADLKAIRDTSRYIHINGEEVLISWISKVRLSKKSGTVKIRLDEDLKPYLLQLRQNYTDYQLIWVLNFQSKYSVILYELFKSVHYDESRPYTWTMTTENLREYVFAGDSYKTWANMKQRILDPAIKEINTLSDKTVSYKVKKEGKKVKSVEFTIQQKKPQEVEELKEQIDRDLNADQYSLFDALNI